MSALSFCRGRGLATLFHAASAASVHQRAELIPTAVQGSAVGTVRNALVQSNADGQLGFPFGATSDSAATAILLHVLVVKGSVTLSKLLKFSVPQFSPL